MPITHKLKRQLQCDVLERDLQKDFPDISVKRGLTGTIKAKVRFDMIVRFCIKNDKVQIYAAHPLFYAFFFGGGRFGFAEDEKRFFEKQYAQWFTERYPDYLANR